MVCLDGPDLIDGRRGIEVGDDDGVLIEEQVDGLLKVDVLLEALEDDLSGFGVDNVEVEQLVLEVLGEDSEIGVVDELEEHSSVIPERDPGVLVAFVVAALDGHELVVEVDVPNLNEDVADQRVPLDLVGSLVVLVEDELVVELELGYSGVGDDVVLVVDEEE